MSGLSLESSSERPELVPLPPAASTWTVPCGLSLISVRSPRGRRAVVAGPHFDKDEVDGGTLAPSYESP